MPRLAHSIGGYLTNQCGAAPLTGPQAKASRADSSADPAYVEAFEESPYPAGCAAWGVRPDRTEPTRTTGGIPLLLLAGSLDSFSPPSETRSAAGTLGPQAHVLEIRGGTHNVLGFSECAIAARNDWARAPGHAPGTACADAPPVDFR